MKENAWPSTNRKFVFRDDLAKEWSRKSRSKLIKTDNWKTDNPGKS